MLIGENTSSSRGATQRNFVIRLSAFAVLLMLFLIPATAEELEREVIEGTGVSVMFSPGRKAFAESALSTYLTALAELEEKLGLSPQRKAYIVLSRTQTEFRDITGGSTHTWIAALAYSSENLIVIDGSKIEIIGMNDLKITLSHELTHLLLGKLLEKGAKLPVWFNEGVAMWASIPRFTLPREELVLAAKSGALLHYSSLHDSFPASRKGAQLAYAESHEFISYLENRFGEGTVKAVIQEMNHGVQVADALLHVAGKTLDELWNDWTETLYRRSGFLAAVRLISRRGLPLFGIIAVLVVLGYLRYLLVKRRKMKRWEEEERMGYW